MSLKSLVTAAVLALGLGTGAASAITLPFSWSGTPTFTLSQTFAMSSNFELVHLSYNGSASDQTGYILSDGTTVYTTMSSACQSGGFPVCNLVNQSTVGDILLANVPAGSYTLTIYDSATPNPGSVSFAANAIPLPAAGLLLLGALGIGVAARRSRTAA